MSEVQDHPNVEKLPLEVDGVAVREIVRNLFRDPTNGKPDDISKAGCLALASHGFLVWNAWRDKFPPVGYLLTDNGSLTNIADFSEQNYSVIGTHDNFDKFQFGDNANFSHTKFGHFTRFEGAQFGNGANFSGSEFFGNAYFLGSQFGIDANFTNVKFKRNAYFVARSWNALTVLYKNHKEFAEVWANHRGIHPDTFLSIDFSKSQFDGRVYFTDRKFKGSTFFRNCIFTSPPSFHGCTLNQNTSFDESKFPSATGNRSAARAYRTLKLAFCQQQAIREEQRFFRLEIAEETLLETGLKRWLFMAYKQFSDFGFSIARPLIYGGGAVFVITSLYGIFSWMGQCKLGFNNCNFAPQWLEFSLLQTLPLPGLDKLSDVASKAFWPTGAWWNLALSVLVIAQKIISFAVLFLVGLALRNLFKLK